MEDIMLIRSSFLRRIISQIINKMLKKQLPGTEVRLGEVQANWSEKEQKLKIHLVVDAEMTKAQLMEMYNVGKTKIEDIPASSIL